MNRFTNAAVPMLMVLGLASGNGAGAQQPNFHGSPAPNNGVPLHVNPRWKECSFQLNAALTQAAWRQFTDEAAVVVYFRPLSDARPMGRGRSEFSVLQWKAGIKASDAAWNDTFVHPDSTHWLFEGDGLQFPGASGRVGLSDRTDLGVYFTKNPNANYGFYGVQLQHSLLSDRPGDAPKPWGLAVRGSYVSLFGPEDVKFSVFGADAVVSRSLRVPGQIQLSPYAALSGTLARSHEQSSVVSVRDEAVLGAQATAGVAADWRMLHLAAEVVAARVPSMSLKIGIGRGR